MTAGADIVYSLLTPGDAGFAAACGEVAGLFAGREREFHFNSSIPRPQVDAGAFCSAPVATVSAAVDQAAPVVILTTWSDRVGSSLVEAGFDRDPVSWPAGPANTAIFRRPGEGPPCYLEIVNEDDPAIAPNLVLAATDRQGLVGGAISVLRADAAWLAVMCVRAGGPAGTGTRLWGALLDAYRRNGIERLDFGTQTAGPFYRQRGATLTHLAIRDLRWREGGDGPIWTDLEMMTLSIRDAGRSIWE